ncbi:MAG: tRNA uridine-5-carboxymethylaminomethyl(34) synthesis GTPase MnmE [Pseudomonadaceae bacterium]|nr:tRNA uridine-5-carboxymethylaminomethyl(34) synthesis GTPase MnmE [Pseudomonadaceae bacterium]
MNGDTIVALATAPLPAGVAVIRLSGPRALEVGTWLVPRLHHADAGKLVFGPIGNGLDDGMAVKFAAPRSFTGEDVVEIHTHGGRAVVQAVLDACTAFDDVRQALPGEFSRRAVMNGKMDITAAEGLADLIDATTEAQRRQALRQLDGALGKRFETWRTHVLALLAQVEAAIDFPDEELEVLAEPALAAGMKDLLADLQAAAQEKAGERLRDGVRLAIVGKPNAGKSTLLNLLAGRDVAIVSPIAGTTRDVVTSTLDIGGFPVVVADTAGLRNTEDAIEAEGVKRARAQALAADVVVAVVDGHDFPQALDELAPLLVEDRTLLVVSRAEMFELDFPSKHQGFPVVAANLTEQEALRRILPALTNLVENVAGGAAEAALLTRVRHRAAVDDAIAHLGNALAMVLKAAHHGTSVAELVAEDLRSAANAIGTVTGRTGSEDVLDVVFSSFCIGK